MSRLRRAGVPEDDSHMYAEGVRRGGSLVIARLADDNVDRGLEIMSNYRPVDIDERGSQWRTEGWTPLRRIGWPLYRKRLDPGGDRDAGHNETASESDRH